MSEAKRLRLSDIPLEVLESVYQKWSKAIEHGWGDRLWTQCALCIYCNEHQRQHHKFNGCNICPLPPTFFCKNNDVSELHINAHNSEEEWKQAVEEFLKFLSQEINKRGDVNDKR